MTMTIDRDAFAVTRRPVGSAASALIRWLRDMDARLGRLHDQWSLWHTRARSRRELLELSDHMLKDIGISRSLAEAEADKPFWRG